NWDDLDAAIVGLLRDDPAADGYPDAPVSPAPMTEVVADAVRRPGIHRPRTAEPDAAGPEADPEATVEATPPAPAPPAEPAGPAAWTLAEAIDEARANVIRRTGYTPPQIDPAAPRHPVTPRRLRLGRHPAGRRVRTEWEARYLRMLVVADLVAAFVAGALAFTVRFGDEVTEYNQAYVILTGLLPLVMIFALVVNRAYERRFLFVGS